MHEQININFKMNINNNGKIHEIQFQDLGKRYIKNQKTYIRLKEPLMEETNYNQLMLICDKTEIVIIRSGFVKMKQPYKENEITKGFYTNKYISSEITTYTKKYDYFDDKIFLDYDILYDNDVIGNYQMEVNIKGVGENE